MNAARRILIAGIGNIFLGDDAFGVEVARLCAARSWPQGVTVRDAGIACLDLALLLGEPWDLVIAIDAVSRGGAPGTLYAIAFQPGAAAEASEELDPHRAGLDQVVAWARRLGATALPPLRLIGCQPLSFAPGPLSAPVAAAVPEAVAMITALVNSVDTLAQSEEVTA